MGNQKQNMTHLYTLTPNPALDLSGHVRSLIPNEKNTVFAIRKDPGGNGINAAKIALAGVTQEAEIGSRTVTELLDAEQQVYQTETEFARAKHDAKFGSYQVLATIGNLTAKDLGLPVTYYNPKLHLDKVKYLPIGF